MIKRLTFTPPGVAPTYADDGAGPLRVVVCTVLDDLTPDPPHGGVVVEWFDHQVDGGDVVAEEHVLRGADWLEQRWHEGGERLKHVALATRQPHLTQVEFQQRWRQHAGTAGGSPIPDEARGRAYAQNHPIPGEWPYDAVNEVWFDDVAGLRRRIEWFAGAFPPGSQDELFAAHAFLAVRELVVRA